MLALARNLALRPPEVISGDRRNGLVIDFQPTELSADPAKEVLGYLNFSSGTEDPRFLRELDALYRSAMVVAESAADGWKIVRDQLAMRLDQLARESDAFSETNQARRTLSLCFDYLLGAYRQFHRDLLFHQSDEVLWSPFFIGRACESILHVAVESDDPDEIVHAAILRLNDFVGYRPVPVLRTNQKMEPYAHERVRPLPLYVRGAGVGCGEYEEIILQTLQILQDAPPEILEEAGFNLA